MNTKSILILVIFTLNILFVNAQNMVTVKITSDKEIYSQEKDITLLFEVTNISNEKFRMCKYQTPFEGFKSPYLKIINLDTGNEIEYSGIMVKRQAPTSSDYVKIGKKKSLKSAVKVKSAYNLNTAGRYSIQFKGSLINKLPDSNIIEIEIK